MYLNSKKDKYKYTLHVLYINIIIFFMINTNVFKYLNIKEDKYVNIIV